MKRKLSGLILIGFLVITAFSESFAQDWPWFRGLNHDGISTTAMQWPVKNSFKRNVYLYDL